MKNIFASLLSGTIFGLGLGISGMMSPIKVKGFLDLTRGWDPSLMLVMGGALLVSFIAFPLVLKRKAPLCDTKFAIPTKINLDKEIFVGPALFGIGWGLMGLCPGPAIANISTGNTNAIVFAIIMVITMALTDKVKALLSK